MPLYFLDPNDEERECPHPDPIPLPACCQENERRGRPACCRDDLDCDICGHPMGDRPACDYCHCMHCKGTGRIGNPDGPRVELHFQAQGWVWRPFPLDGFPWTGPFPTQDAALEAAREAHARREDVA